MISIVLHLVLAAATSVAVLAAFRIWKKQKLDNNALVKYYVIFFIFSFLYHLCLSLPYFFSFGNLFLTAWGYIIGISCIFLMIFFVFKILAYLFGFSVNKIRGFETATLLVGVLVFFIQIFDLRLPIVLASGYIVWNNNLLAGGLTFAATFCGSLAFVFSFVNNLDKAENNIEKIKLYFLTVGTLFIGVSSIYFVSRTLIFLQLSFIFHFLAILFFSGAFLAHQRIKIKL
jgi:hypothetical protein